MKTYCKELDKHFDSKDDLFKALVENEQIVINAKKSEIYKSCEKGLQVFTSQENIKKSFEEDAEKGIKFDEDFYYFVVNSANILDSHNDVHVDGNWNKTVKEQQGKVYLVFDHSTKRDDVIAMAEDIELLTAKVKWSFLGKNYDGETYSLIYKVPKNRIVNKQAKEWLENGYNLKASVRMQYIKLEMAFNSKNPEYAKQKAVFDQYYPIIANKDEFSKIDYFTVVKEAKNVMESSLVLFPSNNATGRIDNKKREAVNNDTSETIEQSNNDTQSKTAKKVLIF